VFLSPAIIALIACSLMVGGMTVFASMFGLQIITGWDIRSGSQKQLDLERKTYLISTVLNYVMVCQLFSLFLFVATADRIHDLFPGAMCAAGTLYVNPYGYATLVLKIMSFILGGIWLIVNHVDHQGYDYPLIKFKYKFLVGVTFLILFETVLQLRYLAALDPEVITSCCGALFGDNAQNIAADVAHLPSFGTMIVFYGGMLLMLGVGTRFYMTGKHAAIFSGLSSGLFLVCIAAIISFISVYFYELPTHHCPFCLLQVEYHHVGYILYLFLFGAGIMGAGAGVVQPFKNLESLKNIIPAVQKRLCLGCVLAYTAFALVATYPLIFSDFKLEGY